MCSRRVWEKKKKRDKGEREGETGKVITSAGVDREIFSIWWSSRSDRTRDLEDLRGPVDRQQRELREDRAKRERERKNAQCREEVNVKTVKTDECKLVHEYKTLFRLIIDEFRRIFPCRRLRLSATRADRSLGLDLDRAYDREV